MLARLLAGAFDSELASDWGPASRAVAETQPDLVLVDARMAHEDAYWFCKTLRSDEATTKTPLLFMSHSKEVWQRADAAVGGSTTYVQRPLSRETLIQTLQSCLRATTHVAKARTTTGHRLSPDFRAFKTFLCEQLNLTADAVTEISGVAVSGPYDLTRALDVTSKEVATLIAQHLAVDYVGFVDPQDVALDAIASRFCRANDVLPLRQERSGVSFLVSNPFDLNVFDDLKTQSGRSFAYGVAEPELIDAVWRELMGVPVRDSSTGDERVKMVSSAGHEDDADVEESSIIYVTNNILHTAVNERATDVHVEPKGDETAIRFRVDGDMRDAGALRPDRASGVVSRLKALADLDITERRKPQDGVLEIVVDQREFQLRLSTAPTPEGESLTIRLLEPGAKTKTLKELGMTNDQADLLTTLAERTQGLLLVVGPTGSGKTTTIYSLLSQIDCETKRLITIEDPVEYRIPFANQQQVNEKAGVTFDALLRASVRQDPDILFMGEIRDEHTARIAVDFASTGHLAIATLHTTDATTAIFRLERLGVTRAQMAESLIAVAAQRLLRKLCANCKLTASPTEQEAAMLAPFLTAVPGQLGQPGRCGECENTGYFGREVVCEVIEFTPEISTMVRADAGVAEIRSFIRERDGYLIANHAAAKVRDRICSPRDAYERVLVEETPATPQPVSPKPPTARPPAEPKPEPQTEADEHTSSILVVEDNQDSRKLLVRFLEKQGYRIATAEDGADALLYLGAEEFDLIISDVNMPNLSGFQLAEIREKKGLKTPIIFLTARDSDQDEARGLKLGAADYITKPVRKDTLITRVGRVLDSRED